MKTLVIAEHDNVSLKPATLTALGAAAKVGAPVSVLVAGHQADGAAKAAAAVPGVAEVLQADGPAYAAFLAENVAAVVVKLAPEFTHILMPATSQGKNILPRVAALLDSAPVSDVIDIESPDTFRHPIYAGNAIATVQNPQPIKLMTIRTTAFESVASTGGNAPIKAVEATAPNALVQFVSQEAVKSDRPELTAARVVVSGGRGVGSADNFKLIEDLADVLGGAVGASRSAVDSGFVANDKQVGQTGKIVAPELYIAVGISGAIQHLAGMKDSKVIVAINKDPDAPIFGVADYGLVADLFQAVPELTKTLKG